MVNCRVDASHGESANFNRSIREKFPDPLETKTIREELQKLSWEQVIEFLEISIVDWNHAENHTCERFLALCASAHCTDGCRVPRLSQRSCLSCTDEPYNSRETSPAL